MRVTKIDQAAGFVEGRYPPDFLEKEPKVNSNENFRFRVRELDWLVKTNQLRVGGDYYFNNDHGSSFLEAFPEGYGPEEVYKH
jgi:hypothetical protein